MNIHSCQNHHLDEVMKCSHPSLITSMKGGAPSVKDSTCSAKLFTADSSDI